MSGITHRSVYVLKKKLFDFSNFETRLEMRSGRAVNTTKNFYTSLVKRYITHINAHND